MQVSAEIRWFWKGAIPHELLVWFQRAERHGCASGGGSVRTDAYLRDARQSELGLKLRGGKKGVEIKGLVAVIAEGCQASPFIGPIDIWSKWSSEVLSLEGLPLIEVEKRRWLRTFDTAPKEVREIALDMEERPIGGLVLPDEGCNVEYTEIRIGEDWNWASLGFESFGTLTTLADSLRRTAAVLASRQPPKLDAGWLASYPTWLQHLSGSA